MTAEADVHRDTGESDVSKGEVLNANGSGNGNVNENGNGNGNVNENGNGNQNENASGNGNGIAKDDTDGSYVFVTGSDAMISEDPVESDLNQNNGGLCLGDSVVAHEDNPQSHSLNEVAEESPSLNDEEGESVPQIALANSHLQSDKDPKLPKEVLLEDASRDLGQDSEHDSMPTPLDKQVVCDPVSEEIQAGLPACHADDGTPENLDEQNGSSENGQVVPAPIICENVSFQVEMKSATEVVNGTVSDKNNEDGLPTVHAQERISEPVATNDLVGTPEENGSCENSESCEKVPFENGKSFSTVADNGTIGNPDVGNGVSQPTEDVSTSAVGDARPETDAVKLNDKSSESPKHFPLEQSKSDTEAESAPVIDDAESNFRANDAISEDLEPNSKSEIESEIVPIVGDTLSSFPADDAISEPNSKSEVESESAPILGDTLSSCPANDAIAEHNSKSEVEPETAPVIDDTLSSCPANDAICEHNSKSELEFESAPIVDDTLASCPANDVISEPKTSHDSIGCEEKASNDAKDVDSGLSNLEVESAASPPVSVTDDNSNEASLPAKPEAEVHTTSALRSRDIPEDVCDTSESRVLNDSSVENDRPLNCNLDDVQIGTELNSTYQVMECTNGIHRFEASTSSQEVSTTNALEGENKDADVEKRPFYFLIRIPRYDDENLKEQIKRTQLHVEEKTKIRDSIGSKVQMARATCKEYFHNVEAARSEERVARDLFNAKLKDMHSVQSMINRVKNAISVEDTVNKIRNMEHIMKHETVPLKEEKKFIREISQLKQLRDQLSSNLGKKDEVQQALDQKDDIENRSKVLRKEMDLLRDNLLKAEAVTQAAKKKFNEENNMLKELESQFKAANGIRQEAYAHLQSLRTQQNEKNKYFWRYKDDARAANNLALSGNRDQLQHFCIKQVETIMELWNKNDGFRKEYMRCNNRSTLRRLRTSDGRALGPDEVPPVIPDIVRATKDNLVTARSTAEQAKQVPPVDSEKPDNKSAMKAAQPKKEIAKGKKPVTLSSTEISPETASGRNEIEDERVEDPKLTKEEEELARKAEELRKEEAAARLREQRRLEEKEKAKEALERKKRIAEKAQARATIRAQKEAEEKEKEREKRVRKKERKKATTTKATNGINEGESAPEPSSETPTGTPEESETREKPMTITKRPQKSSQFAKQSKVKSIPLPLRNRSKRRMQPWMWVLVAILAIFALFLLGNGGSSYFKSLLKKLL